MWVNNYFKIILTVGPSILEGNRLERLPEGVDYIFRLNGSHLSAASCEDLVRRIRGSVKGAVILLDLPGNKIRTARLKEPIKLNVGEKFRLTEGMINHRIFLDRVEVGDIIRAHDSLLVFEVIEKNADCIEFLSHTNGVLRDNKGLHRCGLTDGIDFLTDHDRKLLDIAKNLKIECIGASYIRDKEDILSLKKLLSENEYTPEVFVKIETKKAVENLSDILSGADNFILDRGDLSSEVGIENISFHQQKIINEARKKKRNLFLATQFLKSMVHNPVPLIAEVNDLSNVLGQGVCGLQLSDETAMGKYPIESINVILQLRRNFYNG